MIQFTRQGAFTCKAGDLIVSGYYREPPADSSSPPGAYLLTNGASVFFGGLEFRMEDRSGFALHYEDGGAEKIVPEYMVLTEDAASFRLPGGSELNFSTRGPTGKAELRISGSFDDHVQRLELPYRLLRNSRMRKSEDGKVRITAGGTDYAFEAAELDTASRTLAITAGGAAVSYRAVPENKSFIPDDLVIPAALDLEEYEALLTQWRDQAFALWSQAVKTANDEAVVTAYLGESIRRGGYKAAVSSISPAFLNGERRTFASSVYLGRLDIGLRSLSAAERDKQSRLSRLILDEKSPDFLGEPHVFAYLETRHNTALINGGIEIVRDLDPSSLSPDRAPGILEGWYDWHLYRPNEENPFARLLDQACFAIAAAAQKSPPGDRLFVFSGTSADTEFNLRLGKALTLYGETAGNKTWAALGRSLILSVLSLADASGTLPEAVSSGEDAESPRRLDSAGIYRFLASGTYPHAVTIGHPPEGVWAWTVAQVSSVRENNVLDISVSFSEGETHYMIIRGIRPFSKIQLYGIDYRTDPQFERYDSSGWSYSSSEQTLLVKMRHRAAVEHIRIYS